MKTKEIGLRRELRRKKISKTILTVVLTTIAVTQFYPLLWMVLFSLKDNPEIFRGNFFPGAFRTENYVAAWKHSKLGRAFFNSFYITVFTVVLSLLLSSMTAYAVTRMRWKLRRTVYIYALLGLHIPIHAALLPLMLTMKSVGLLGSRWAVILPYTAFNMSFCVMIFSGFMETINLSVSNLYGQYNTNLGIVGAALTMSIIPTVTLYMLMSNRVQQELTGAAIKG